MITLLAMLLSQAVPPLPDGFHLESLPGDWQLVNVSESGSAFYIRRGQMNQGGDEVTAWIRGLHERDRGVPYRRSMTLYRYNCRLRISQERQFITYKADGSIHSSYTIPRESREVVPESLGEAWLDAACAD